MFRRVMWATDGSEAADKALPVVKMLAADRDTEVLVVHCQEMTLPGRGGQSVPVNANEEDLRAKIETQVTELSR